MLNEDGTFYPAELLKGGLGVCAVVEAKEPKQPEGNPVELGFTFETRGKPEHALSVLSRSGTVTLEPCEPPWNPCAAAVTDCFGVNWFLSLPQHRPPEDWVPET